MTLSDLEFFEYILDERHLKNASDRKKRTSILDRLHRLRIDEVKEEGDYVFTKDDESWNDVIDCKLLERIEKVLRERWDSLINNENELGDAINLYSKKMTSLFQIDDAFQIRENQQRFQQISQCLLNGGGDLSRIAGIDEEIELKRDDRSSEEEEESSDDEDNDDGERGEDEDTGKLVLLPLAPGDALYDKKSMTKDQLKMMRRANKKMVKAYNKERRKHKLPKKVKRRKIKVARRKAGKSVWHVKK